MNNYNINQNSNSNQESRKKMKNTEDTSKEMINMYSRDLAEYIAETKSNVQEIAIFWEIPYLDVNAKAFI